MRIIAWLASIGMLVVPGMVNSPDVTGVDTMSPETVPARFPGEGSPWALAQIELPMDDPASDQRPVFVAVLDTGIDAGHADLAGQVAGAVNLTDSPTSQDVYGHGTHIAGIIAAQVNDIGIDGIAPASRLLNVKVADDQGRCTAETVARGIHWAVANGANVINISVELDADSPVLAEAVDYAWGQGVVIVAAAGNEGNSHPAYPAGYRHCLAVAATTGNDSLAPLSNYGSWVDVAAPGSGIYSTLPGNTYGEKSGTSFAAAYVSGLAARLYARARDTNGDGWLNDEVRRAIEEGADDIGLSGIGQGRVNAWKSLELITAGR